MYVQIIVNMNTIQYVPLVTADMTHSAANRFLVWFGEGKGAPVCLKTGC